MSRKVRRLERMVDKMRRDLVRFEQDERRRGELMSNMYLRLVVEDAQAHLQAAMSAVRGESVAALLLDQALLLVQDALTELEEEN